jgi:hypothetical protein
MFACLASHNDDVTIRICSKDIGIDARLLEQRFCVVPSDQLAILRRLAASDSIANNVYM